MSDPIETLAKATYDSRVPTIKFNHASAWEKVPPYLQKGLLKRAEQTLAQLNEMGWVLTDYNDQAR